jgi:hypothetical protein
MQALCTSESRSNIRMRTNTHKHTVPVHLAKPLFSLQASAAVQPIARVKTTYFRIALSGASASAPNRKENDRLSTCGRSVMLNTDLKPRP